MIRIKYTQVGQVICLFMVGFSCQFQILFVSTQKLYFETKSQRLLKIRKPVLRKYLKQSKIVARPLVRKQDWFLSLTLPEKNPVPFLYHPQIDGYNGIVFCQLAAADEKLHGHQMWYSFSPHKKHENKDVK